MWQGLLYVANGVAVTYTCTICLLRYLTTLFAVDKSDYYALFITSRLVNDHFDIPSNYTSTSIIPEMPWSETEGVTTP